MVPRRLIRKLEILTDEAQTHIEHLADQLGQMPDQCRHHERTTILRLVGDFFRGDRVPSPIADRLPRPSMLAMTLSPSDTLSIQTGTALSPGDHAEPVVGRFRRVVIHHTPPLLGAADGFAEGIGGLSLADLEQSCPEPEPLDPTRPPLPRWVREELQVVARLAADQRARRRTRPD